MLKYVDAKVVFTEVPDHITLCINISNCPCHCIGCHSPYLAEDIGTDLSEDELFKLIEANKGITCVAFMGGDACQKEVDYLAERTKDRYPKLKVAWYSGKENLSRINLWNFDFIKLGPYKEEFGPLNKRTTNQRMYRVVHTDTVDKLYDITNRFYDRKYEIKD